MIVINQERINIKSKKSTKILQAPAGIDERIGFPLARTTLDSKDESGVQRRNVTMLIFLSLNKVVEVTYLDEFSRLEMRKFDGTQFSAIREWASHNMLLSYLRANWEIRGSELNPLQALINMHIPWRVGNHRSEFTAQYLHEALGVPAKDIDGIGLRAGDLWNINVDGKFWMYWKHSLSINNS